MNMTLKKKGYKINEIAKCECSSNIIYINIADKLDKCENINNIRYIDGYYIFEYKDKIKYKISQNKMFIDSINFEYFTSTFFNIPLSVWLILNNRILLHTNGLVFNNKLYPFCGKKGVGKSTLVLSNVFNNKNIKFFSDDTICIGFEKEKLFAYCPINIIKLHKDSYDLLIDDGNFELRQKNIMNKAYVEIEEKYLHNCNKIELETLFLLDRNNNICCIEIEDITNNLQKKEILVSNVIGYKYLERTLLMKVINIFKKIDISSLHIIRLNIPNDLNYMINNFWEDLINEKI